MASRTKQKEEARARRLAEEQARASRAHRDRRLRMLLGVVLAAVVVVVVAIVVSSSGGGSHETGLQSGGKSSQTVAAVQKLLNGIPQSGATLGDSSAPVTMTYYGDLQCPVCRAFTLTGGFSQLVSNDVRRGKVKVVYKAFQTATRDPNVFKTQQVAALAAGEQQKFWDFAELFYHEQGQEDTGYVTESYLRRLAAQVPGLDLVKWQSDRNNAALASQVAADGASGNAIGVSGTPTLIFSGPKGQAAAPEAVPTYAQLQQTLKKVQ
jgi:protein-disulfide isomerase